MGTAAAACFTPALAQANRPHLFSGLTDVRASQAAGEPVLFQPEPGKHVVALFMTAQQSYISCGEDLAGIVQIMQYMGLEDRITPVVIMPNAQNQSDPTDSRNLNSIWANPDFRVLTGSLDEIQRVVGRIPRAFFEYDENRRIDGHTRDAFFFDENGDFWRSFRADSMFYSYRGQIGLHFGTCRRTWLGDLDCE